MNVKRKRVSTEQRQKLLEFMMGHANFARGRISGPDASRTKTALLKQLTDVLNAIGSGATKDPEKWLKCWQDWRSDTKAKAVRIKKYSMGTGGGPGPAPLSRLEEELLQFCGVEMVQGVDDVPDPLELEVPREILIAEGGTIDPQVLLEDTPEVPTCAPTFQEGSCSRPSHGRHRNDPLQSSLERQAAAIEDWRQVCMG